MAYQMNSRGDLPGFGDFMPPDDSRAQLRDDAVAEETDAVLREWLADRTYFSEYASSITEERWEEFERAVEMCDDIEACRVYRLALIEQMRGDARREAARRVDARAVEAMEV